MSNLSFTIEELKKELAKLKFAQAGCITEKGFIRTGYQERYNMLTGKIRSFKESINWLEAMQEPEAAGK